MSILLSYDYIISDIFDIINLTCIINLIYHKSNLLESTIFSTELIIIVVNMFFSSTRKLLWR